MTLFHDRLGNALAQAHRHARKLAVLFVDVDKFKSVNDEHGHDIGEATTDGGPSQLLRRRCQSPRHPCY